MSKVESNISPQLLALIENSSDRESTDSRRSSLVFNPDRTDVLTRITTPDTEALTASLETLGISVLASDSELYTLETFIPIEQLETVAQLPETMGILPIRQSITRAGSVTSQADFVQEANRVRSALPEGFDGTGITIGILSVSYDLLDGAAADIANEDLPPEGVEVIAETPETPIDPLTGEVISFAIDEGRAMAQLIHDLAPGADLQFATTVNEAGIFSPLVFAESIRSLAENGADILVDDIGILEEPFFQDGIVPQAVNEVVEEFGVAYFSAAGNDASVGYESTNPNFVADPELASKLEISDALFYDFDPDSGVDTRQRVTIFEEQPIRLELRWDDPFFTLDGVETDLDFYLLDSAGNVVADSTESNLVNQVPSEFIRFTNATEQTDFDVVISLSEGEEPERIKYIPFGTGDFFYQEFATNSPTIFGHPAAENAFSVGAVPYFDQDNPEPFTSTGPTTILFEADGTPKATPEVRLGPDASGVDATNTTFLFGPDIENDGFPNFFGTSAAAPHVAAIASLVLQANPDLTPQELYDQLTETAIDIAEPGFDNVTGAGLVNAYDAVFGPAQSASLPFEDDFEDGDLSIAYETRSTNNGRIQVTGEDDPIGTAHLRLDAVFLPDAPPDVLGDALNEVILRVDTTGVENVELSFAQREFQDGDNSMPEQFQGSVDADGVALSVDGENWYRLISLTGANSQQTYQTQTFDLTQFAADNGLTLGSDVQIKFQQFNDSLTPENGFAFDNIQVVDSDDVVTGTDGRDTLAGGFGDDDISGDGGDDLLRGDNNSRANGGLIGGDDIISGGDGNDRMGGKGGNDQLFGGAGNDQIWGDAGDDLIDGGAGDDELWGDSSTLSDGADTFVLAAGNGTDTIFDFEVGIDSLQLTDGLTVEELSVITVGNNTEIVLNDETLAILQNVVVENPTVLGFSQV